MLKIDQLYFARCFASSILKMVEFYKRPLNVIDTQMYGEIVMNIFHSNDEWCDYFTDSLSSRGLTLNPATDHIYTDDVIDNDVVFVELKDVLLLIDDKRLVEQILKMKKES